ncbi:MAG: cation:proton antiporter [Desulfurivibrionaceae bacterium]
MHDSGIIALLFVVSALFIGSLFKALMRSSRLPYTVVLLVAGIAMGGMGRVEWFGTGLVDGMLQQVGNIDPHLILFLFLPTLIFEATYSLESHLFFRIVPQIVLLAVPGLLISMFLSALVASWLLPWGLGAALLFGALISATDPVAVVALLKEKTSRKRLQTLIEGESLLNDGTAIVLFSLFYGFVIGGTGIEPLSAAGEFVLVVSGGLLIGILTGWLVLAVIDRLINQPLIEISLSIGAAYITFISAEALEVSGIVALVALGLMFSTLGRTRVSPEVSHFLHQFWEMMAYIANTLIFLIVGIVIALHVSLDSPYLWLVLIIMYIVLMLIRTATVWSLKPILSRISIGITGKKTTVLVWGGLRGAVALSLALSLAQDQAVPEVLGQQMLFLTAGIVVLTIVLNGSSMAWLLHRLQLDILPPAKEASVQKARENIRLRMDEFLENLKKNPFFDKVEVEKLDRIIDDYCLGDSCPLPGRAMEEDVEVAFRRRLLEIERSDYWRQFEEGHIGRRAAFELSRSVEQALDNRPEIAPRPILEPVLTVPTPPGWMQHIPMMADYLQKWLFSRLSLGYDVARGFVEAQEEMRRHIDELKPGPEAGKMAEEMIDRNCRQAFIFTRHLGSRYPELVRSLQTLSAKRFMLNHQRSLIWKMQHEGILEEAEARHLIKHIEDSMRRIKEEQDRG